MPPGRCADSLAAISAYAHRAFAPAAGALTPVARIDLTARCGPGGASGGYLFNRIFLPEEAAPAG
jgi:hypothetical protein